MARSFMRIIGAHGLRRGLVFFGLAVPAVVATFNISLSHNGLANSMPAPVASTAPSEPASSTLDSHGLIQPVQSATLVPQRVELSWSMHGPDREMANHGEPMAYDPYRASTILFPEVGTRFSGIDDTGKIPPDVDVAAGYSALFQTANDVFRIINKCGSSPGDFSFAAWLDPSYEYFSPKVAYDDIDAHWIMAVARTKTLAQESQILIMASQSGDPVGAWHYVTIDVHTITPSGWGDLVDIGFNSSWLCATWDTYTWGPSPTQNTNGILQLDKAGLYAGGTVGGQMWLAVTNPADGSLAAGVRPARMRSSSSDLWLAATKSNGGGFITLWKLFGQQQSPGLASYTVNVPVYDPPAPMIQPDSTFVDAGDARLGGVVFRADTLYACHAEFYDWGEYIPRSVLSLYEIEASTQTLIQKTSGGALGTHSAFPGIDIDDAGRIVIPYAYISENGDEDYLSAHFIGVSENGVWLPTYQMSNGVTNYSHAGSEPWSWGGPLAVAVDPSDNKTFWVCGPFASNAPDPSWDTQIYSVSWEQYAQLQVGPPDTTSVVGVEGGPFDPAEVEYTIYNGGATSVPWEVTNLASWMSASPSSFTTSPYSTDTCRVTINAQGLSPGEYVHTISFNDCYAMVTHFRTIHLLVGDDGYCPGTLLFFAPNPTPTSMLDDNQDRGIHITAIEDFEVCAVGMSNDLVVPQDITANIYALNGGVRDALIASTTHTATQSGEAFHYVPINTVLQACQEYEIAFEFGTSNVWSAWNETAVTLPFDVAGVRVRDGTSFGNAGDPILPYISIVGEPLDCNETTILEVPNAVYQNRVETLYLYRGVYVTAYKTMKICHLGMTLDPPSQGPTTLTAQIYEATGTTRGDLIALGSTEVNDDGSAMYWIPINVTMQEGRNYDLEVGFPQFTEFACVDEDTVGLGFLAGEAVFVLDGEAGGSPVTDLLGHFGLRLTTGAGGEPFDLAKPSGSYPPPNTESVPMRYGMYVTSLIDQEIYAVDFMGDFAIGDEITARIYDATGTTRGSLVGQGTVKSSAEGMRWHTIPLSVTLASPQEYDIEIDAPVIQEWRYWTDTTGLPYEPYGIVRVRDGEHGGDASDTHLIELRLHACHVTATGIASETTRPPAFYLSQAYPNPTTDRSTIRFSLDVPAPVSVTVYNVSGQRVATLVDAEPRLAGPGSVLLDASHLASGIYFVKMATPTKSLARKIVVVR